MWTPGMAQALLVSTDTMRAWAWGLRRISMCSIPGSLKSSVKLPLPRMRRSSSTRLTRAPSPPTEISSTAMSPLPLLLASGVDGGPRGRHLPRRPLHGVDDALVTGAAAEIARDGPPDVPGGRLGADLQQCRRRQHHARRAKPALQPGLRCEALLEGVQLVRPAQAFDGGEPMPVSL